MRHEIITAEKVPFSYRVAGLGSRFLAWLTDVGLVVLLGFAGFCAASVFAALKPGLAMAVFSFWTFGLLWGYFVFFEWFWRGQTPGKRMLGIRVIQDDGTSINFYQAAVRNLLRVVDAMPWVLGFLPVCYGAGFAMAAANAKQRRLGDWAAGTLAVHVERQPKLVRALHDASREPLLLPESVVRQRLGQLTRPQKEVLLDLCLRRDQLRISDRAQLFRAAADYLKTRLDLPAAEHQSDEKFVLQLAAALAPTPGTALAATYQGSNA